MMHSSEKEKYICDEKHFTRHLSGWQADSDYFGKKLQLL